MWTANIKGKRFEKGQLIITVELTNGESTVDHIINLQNPQSPEYVSDSIKFKLKNLQELEDYGDGIPTGDFSPKPHKEPPQPSQDELDKEQWLSDYALLQAQRKAVEAGLMKEADIATLELAVKTNFKPEYATQIAV